jgi:hypothetical protein
METPNANGQDQPVTEHIIEIDVDLMARMILSDCHTTVARAQAAAKRIGAYLISLDKEVVQ